MGIEDLASNFKKTLDMLVFFLGSLWKPVVYKGCEVV